MKIIQVQTQAEAAGAQRVSDMVARGLKARGHTVRTVFMYRKTDAYDTDPDADFVLRQPPRGLPGQLWAAIGLIGYMRRQRPDAVISYQHYGNIFGTIAGRLAGARVLIANQSGMPEKTGVLGLTSRIDALMGRLGAYHYSVVNSAATEDMFARHPRAYRKRIRRIDHGVERPEFIADKVTARSMFGLPGNAFIVVSTGRLTASKNQRVIVEALARLPDVHLTIAGVGPDQPMLEERAKSLGIEDRMHLVGEVPPARIYEFLATGDAYAFASLKETFGLSVAEAAIAGLPIVAGRLAVLEEVLRAPDGAPAALFVDATDAAQMADALARLVADQDLARDLANAGRQLAMKYAPDLMCAQYEALLTSP